MTEEQWKGVEKGIVFKYQHTPLEMKGGQQISTIPKGVKLSHPDYNFEVFCGEGRTTIGNRDLAVVLFKLYLEEVYHD